jgi:hypothetical protein
MRVRFGPGVDSGFVAKHIQLPFVNLAAQHSGRAALLPERCANHIHRRLASDTVDNTALPDRLAFVSVMAGL